MSDDDFDLGYMVGNQERNDNPDELTCPYCEKTFVGLITRVGSVQRVEALEKELKQFKEKFDTSLADYELGVCEKYSKEKERLENFLKAEVKRAEKAKAENTRLKDQIVGKSFLIKALKIKYNHLEYESGNYKTALLFAQERAVKAEADLKKVVESYGISDLYLKEITEE